MTEATVQKSTVHKSTKEQELIDKVEPVLQSMNFSCRDIEVVSGRSALVRITIELANSKEAVSIEHCSEVHRTLNPMFDVWDPLPGAYTLEVSSPGEKPRMRLRSHFEEAVGENLKFQTMEAVEMPGTAKPRKNWEAKLIEVLDEGQIKVEDKEGGIFELPISELKNVVWLREWKA